MCEYDCVSVCVLYNKSLRESSSPFWWTFCCEDDFGCGVTCLCPADYFVCVSSCVCVRETEYVSKGNGHVDWCVCVYLLCVFV